jgi:hypothetical protein
MESKKSSFEVYLQKMQRHFEQNSKIREVQAHSSKVENNLGFPRIPIAVVYIIYITNPTWLNVGCSK